MVQITNTVQTVILKEILQFKKKNQGSNNDIFFVYEKGRKNLPKSDEGNPRKFESGNAEQLGRRLSVGKYLPGNP